MQVYVNGVGLLGPGLAGWAESRAIFAGEHPYRNTPPQIPNASLLPPNERRRSSDMVRWAMHVGQEAMQHAQADAREVATVFASSCGEMGVLDRLCTSLATSQRVVSPTLFHHSVHNAAAGYWGIATGSHQSSTALSCYDSSFCGGLLEAATCVSVNDSQVLLVAYDLPAPFPLSEARPLLGGFAVAFMLAARPSRESIAQLTLSLSCDQAERATTMGEEELEPLRIGNPAARALPLLAALAKDRALTVCLEYQEDQRVLSRMTPCP